MTETTTNYDVTEIAPEPKLTELDELNLQVAAIAGWTDIKHWNGNLKVAYAKKTFIGVNKNHPELGVFVPNYASDLNAIASVFYSFEIPFDFTYSPCCEDHDDQFLAWSQLRHRQEARSPAIALCKLLVELNPKPRTKPEVIEAIFE